MAPYAYLCRSCQHLTSRHLLIEGGDLRVGPYRCHCGCEIAQDGARHGLTQANYDRHVDGGPTPTEEIATMTTTELIQFARDSATVHTAMGRDEYSAHGPLFRRLADELERATRDEEA